MSRSPAEEKRFESYEQGWEALNRLIRADGSFSGHERNKFYVNDGDGRFSDASGVSGIDFPHDGRAFAVFDYDHDGDLDLVLKNRSQPQLQLLRNDGANGRASVRLRLEGRQSNRNGVGARVEVHTDKATRHRTVTLGSGYLSQHSRTLHFGLDGLGEIERVVIRWPSGVEQTLSDVPIDRLVTIVEGEDDYESNTFRDPVVTASSPTEPGRVFEEPGTWLIDPIRVPELDVSSLDGKRYRSSELRGKLWLLNFWATWCAPCRDELRNFQDHRTRLKRAGVEVLAMSVDEPPSEDVVRNFRDELGLELPLLLATTDVVGIWDTLNRHLFDYMTDLAIPTSFLIDESGEIVKVYRGAVSAEQIVRDAENLPRTADERMAKGLPFPGRRLEERFVRNDFELATAFGERGFHAQAELFFASAARENPRAQKIHYNLGTLHAEQARWDEAVTSFLRAVELDPSDAASHANLGHVYAQQGRLDEAADALSKAVVLDPSAADGHNNLGNVYAAMGRERDASAAYLKALEARPDFAQARNNLALVYARRGDFERAIVELEKAIASEPNYAQAHLSLGSVLASVGRVADAIEPLRRAYELEPNPVSCSTLVLAHAELGPDEAERLLSECLERWPGEPELLALAYELTTESR